MTSAAPHYPAQPIHGIAMYCCRLRRTVRFACAGYLTAAIGYWLVSSHLSFERVVLLVFFAALEEVVFRLGLLNSARKRMPLWLAIAGSSVAFAAVHANLTYFPVFLLAGVFLCWVYLAAETVWAPIAVHVAHNVLGYSLRAPGWKPIELAGVEFTGNQVLGFVLIVEAIASIAIGFVLWTRVRRHEAKAASHAIPAPKARGTQPGNERIR